MMLARVVFLLCLACLPGVSQAVPAGDRAAILAVVDAFDRAIQQRDEPGFNALFLPGPRTWQPVYSDATLERLRRRQPTLPKLPSGAQETPAAMIAAIAADPEPSEERFGDLRIESDGEIATVYFDYVFLSAGKAGNHGAEAWQLVRGEAGWKIASVVWSMRDPDEGPTAGWWNAASTAATRGAR